MEVHFNLDNIQDITIHPLVNSGYTWCEVEPPIKTLFGLIIVKNGLESGWCSLGGGHYTADNQGIPILRRINSEELLIDHVLFDENVNGHQWFLRVKVVVKASNERYTKYFNTNEEAKEWVESIKDKSNSRFETIIKE